MKLLKKLQKKSFFVVALVLACIIVLTIQNVYASSGSTVPGMEGVSPPKETTITSNNTYGSYVPQNAIDGDLSTLYNASSGNSTLEMKFPKSIELNFVQMSIANTPPVSNRFVIYGLSNGEWIKIADATRKAEAKYFIVEPIDTTLGFYDGLKIEITASGSWAALNEITIGKRASETPAPSEVPTPTPSPTSTPAPSEVPTPTPSLTPTPSPTSTPAPSGERALLTITMVNGLEKEYDLTVQEVSAFIAWFETRDAGTGPAKYAFNKTWNKGPFSKRTEYVIFEKILNFNVDEYSTKE